MAPAGPLSKISGLTETRESRQGTTISLREAWKVFFRFPSAWILAPLVVAAWSARIALGGWRWWDMAVVLIVIALEAFVEWVTHVMVLHFRPRRIGGRTVDPYVARKHRAHHADPRDLGLVFIPLPVLVELVIGGPVLFLLAIPDHAVGLTTVSATYTMLAIYEWTHYLIHSPYRPRGRYYAYIRRAHWNHHFKNEHYWFGITVHLADHLFRTFPGKAAVETSPTAKTLGVG